MKENIKKKRYYIYASLDGKSAFISTSMQYIAEHLGINAKTISRHLEKDKYYLTDRFIIYRDVEIHTIKRGFAL